MTIRQKQWQLYLLGYYPDQPDGYWGQKSVDATVALQRDYSLDVDGVFGPKTTSLSVSIISKLQNAIGLSVIDIDGLAGTKTHLAVADWQTAHGQKRTGIADRLTLKMVMSAVAQDIPSHDNWWNEIKYFSRSEFKCKCGGRYCNGYPVEPVQQLVRATDQVREHFDAPVVISSGIRCNVHNINSGGVTGSRHKTGKAMDFCVEGKNSDQVLNYVKKLPTIRYCYAIDSKYVHMDVL